MRKFFTIILITVELFIAGRITAQSGCNPDIHIRELGSASNILTIINNHSNPLAYDSSSHSLAFIHRNDASIFDGTSGQLRYDVSSDDGTSWTNNLGLLNPVTFATNPARFPQAVFYNPANSSVSDDAYLAYYATTTNGFVYNGYVSGSRQLDGLPNTEIVNQAGALSNTYIPGGLCEGENGIFWTVDAIYNYTTSTYSGFRIFKGAWNGTDVVWSLNHEINPDFNLSYNGKPQVADWNIAFDPSGIHGWAVFLTHLNGGTSYYQYSPVFYSTDDGGTTWNGPVQLELDSFPEITAIVTAGNHPATAYQVDLAVDMNNHPHAFLNIGSGTGSDYTVEESSVYLFDITNDGTAWKAINITKPDGFKGNIGPTSSVWHFNEPQAARSKDGSMLAFLWTDSEGGAGNNDAPNLYGIYYNVPFSAWSPIQEYTSCTAYNGKILWPRVSPELIKTAGGTYKIPVVFGELNASGNENDPAKFYFIDDLIFSACGILGGPIATITANGSTSFCEGDSVLLETITDSNYTFQWQLNGTDIPGAVSDSIWVSQSGTYAVIVDNGAVCEAEDEVIISVHPYPVVTIQVSGSTIVCPNDSVILFPSDEYALYQWKKNGDDIPGATDSSFAATTDGDYTLFAADDIGCGSLSNTISLTEVSITPPVITGLNPDYCITDTDVELTGIPEGGIFSGGFFSGNIFSPSQTGAGNFTISYEVMDTSGCPAIANENTVVHDLPDVSFSGLNDSYCEQDAIDTLVGNPVGGIFSGSAVNGKLFDPSQALIGENVITYFFTDSFGCANSFADSAAVHESPVVIASNDTSVCPGSPVQLFASGAVSYSWSPGLGLDDSTIANPLATPLIPSNYVVTGFSSEGCAATASVVITVNAVSFSLGNDTSICEGESFLLSVDSVSTNIYKWLKDGIEIPGATNPSYLVTEAGTYSLQVINEFGCTGYDEIFISVNPLPTVTITAAGPTLICPSDSVALLSDSTGFSYYQWLADGIAIIGATSQQYAASPGAEYTLMVTNANGCSGISNIIEVTSLSNVTPVILGLEPDYCIDDGDVVLTGIPEGGTFSGGAFSGNTFSPSATGVGSFNISYTYIDSTGCEIIADLPTDIHELPLVSFSGLNPSYCSNENTVLLTGDPEGGIFSGTGIVNNTFDPSQALTGINSISYFYTDSFTCSNSFSDTTIVNEAPVIYLGADTIICDSNSLILDAGAGFASYNWSTGDTTQTIQLTEEGDYTATVTDLNGCSASDTIHVGIAVCTGLASINTVDGLEIYPNPSTGILNIDIKSPGNDIDISLYDIVGKKLLEKHFDASIQSKPLLLDLSGFDAGTYLMIIINGNIQHFVKVVLEK